MLRTLPDFALLATFVAEELSANDESTAHVLELEVLWLECPTFGTLINNTQNKEIKIALAMILFL